MRKSKIVLVAALILCLLSSIGAHVIQTDFGKVEVTEMLIPGSDGTAISGLLYRPKQASSGNPLPLIIAGHGSFNNKEMQDQNLIELSRRGFIVFAPDSYRHGKSSIHNENMGEYASMVDSVEALYDLNYVDQEKVALVGHSMGADQSNNTARYYIEQEVTGQGVNKISAVLTIGCDPPYTSYEIEGLDTPVPVTIDYGVVEGKYDEWFFKQVDVGMNPARYFDSENARLFIEQVGADVNGSVENGKIYEGTINGETYHRVIYQNPEIHPLNHFSRATAASTINYFYTVLGIPSGYEKIDENNQVWFVKELFNLLGLVGIFMFIYPFSCILLQIPFFSGIISKREATGAPALKSSGQKIGFWIVWVINTALPALLLIPIGFKLIGQETFVPAIYNQLFGEANTNELVGWSVAIAISILIVISVYYLLSGKKNGISIKDWGICVTAGQFFKALLLAIATVFGVYVVVFTFNFLFGTDFRIWVLAVKTFDVSKLQYALVYFPGFAVFYLVNSITSNYNNNITGWKEWQKLLVSCISNVLGMAVLIFIQYSVLINDGTITFNAMRIVNLFPLMVLIPAATIISRQYYKKTGNIYTGSFVFGLFYAIVTCANTMFLGSLF